jgi:predicted phage-related endonuclease
MTDRSKGIGSTDARRIMDGDWLALWREKTARALPVDLSSVFRVQLGLYTEPFHLDWLDASGQVQVVENSRQLVLTAPSDDPPRWATLDALVACEAGAVPIELKHTGSNRSIREVADYYMAQIQHQLMVTGAPYLFFSAIMGNEDPQLVQVDRSDEYIEQLVDLERSFWWHVTADVEPEILPTAKLARIRSTASEILVGGYKDDLDMSRNNQWAALAGEYIELKPKKERFEQVCKDMKTLIPDDRRKVYGLGVVVSRTKKGLQIRAETESSDD